MNAGLGSDPLIRLSDCYDMSAWVVENARGCFAHSYVAVVIPKKIGDDSRPSVKTAIFRDINSHIG